MVGLRQDGVQILDELSEPVRSFTRAFGVLNAVDDAAWSAGFHAE